MLLINHCLSVRRHDKGGCIITLLHFFDAFVASFDQQARLYMSLWWSAKRPLLSLWGLTSLTPKASSRLIVLGCLLLSLGRRSEDTAMEVILRFGRLARAKQVRLSLPLMSRWWSVFDPGVYLVSFILSLWGQQVKPQRDRRHCNGWYKTG